MPVLPAEDDSDLVDRLKRQEGRAVLDLYDRYGKLLFALILNITGDRQTAEDLLAETLLKAWNYIQHLDPTQLALGPWLLVLARNHASEYRHQMSVPEEKARRWSALEARAIYESGEVTNLNTSANRDARQMFLSLPEGDRLIFELAWFESLSFEEIAERLERPISDVITTAERVLAELRGAAA